MSSIPTLPGITSQMVPTGRINTHVLTSGPADGESVVFIHGNASSACLLYTSPSPRDRTRSRMPSSA